MEFTKLQALPESVRIRRGNLSYRKLMDAVRAAAGAWVEVDADGVTGAEMCFKSAALRNAAAYRHMRVSIASGEQKLYVRMVVPDETAHG